jgi:hypothetical protein
MAFKRSGVRLPLAPPLMLLILLLYFGSIFLSMELGYVGEAQGKHLISGHPARTAHTPLEPKIRDS